MIQTIKNFFKGLFNATGSVSSKRVIAFICILLISAAVIVRLSNGIALDEYMWNGVLLFTAACLGMNTFLSSKQMTVKSNIASDMVDKEPNDNTADDAKDVLNSNNP